MSEHKDHAAGTDSSCRLCTKIAYEPSWYASLLFAQVGVALRIGGAQTVST